MSFTRTICLLALVLTVTSLVTGPDISCVIVGTTVLTAAEAPAKSIEQEAPTAGFSADRVEVQPEKEIHFIDESTGTVTSWLWDFGDGTTSTEQNPAHVYPKNGYYTVTLKVTGLNGTDTVKKVEFIRVSEDCGC